MKLRRLFVVAFCLSSTFVNAQTPGSTQYDTLYVQQSPVVHKRNTIIRTEQQVKFYLSGYVSLFKSYNYYVPCEGWDNRMDKYKATVDPALSYSAGINLTYSPNKFVVSTAIDYSMINEKFDYTNEEGTAYSNTNHFSYIDLSVNAGYWLGRANNTVSFIPSAGLTYNYLLHESGSMIALDNPDEVISISSSEKLRSSQLSVNAYFRFIFKPQSRMKYTVEPYYMGNIATITEAKYPYQQYANRVGLRVGLMFSL